MTFETDVAATAERELVLTRIIAAPRARLFRAWTEPGLLKQWFAPLPWTTPHAELDVRPGGTSLVVMRDPDGNEIPNRGVSTWRLSRMSRSCLPMPTQRPGNPRKSHS